MMTTESMVDVMRASIRGEEIQTRPRTSKEWYDVQAPVWNWVSNVYRVKPKPREFVIALDADGDVCAARLDSEPFHGTSWSIATKVVRAREILD